MASSTWDPKLSPSTDPSAVAHQHNSIAALVHPQAFGSLVLRVTFCSTSTFGMLKSCLSCRHAHRLMLGAGVEAVMFRKGKALVCAAGWRMHLPSL